MTNSIFGNLLKSVKKRSGNGEVGTLNSVKHFLPLNLTTHDVFSIVVVLITIIVVLTYLMGA